jgi:Flp pilus assembly protein TadD
MDANAFNNRGNIYTKLKQFEKAIQDYNQAIELDPEYTHAFNNRFFKLF